MPLQLEGVPASATAPEPKPQHRTKSSRRLLFLAFLAFPLLLLAAPIGLSFLRPYQVDLDAYSWVAFVRPLEPGARGGHRHYVAGAGEVHQWSVPLGGTAWNLRCIHWAEGMPPQSLQVTFMK